MHLLTNQYAEQDIRGKEEELVAAFLKSVKDERSDKEAVLALRGTFRVLKPCQIIAN